MVDGHLEVFASLVDFLITEKEVHDVAVRIIGESNTMMMSVRYLLLQEKFGVCNEVAWGLVSSNGHFVVSGRLVHLLQTLVQKVSKFVHGYGVIGICSKTYQGKSNLSSEPILKN